MTVQCELTRTWEGGGDIIEAEGGDFVTGVLNARIRFFCCVGEDGLGGATSNGGINSGRALRNHSHIGTRSFGVQESLFLWIGVRLERSELVQLERNDERGTYGDWGGDNI